MRDWFRSPPRQNLRLQTREKNLKTSVRQHSKHNLKIRRTQRDISATRRRSTEEQDKGVAPRSSIKGWHSTSHRSSTEERCRGATQRRNRRGRTRRSRRKRNLRHLTRSQCTYANSERLTSQRHRACQQSSCRARKLLDVEPAGSASSSVSPNSPKPLIL